MSVHVPYVHVPWNHPPHRTASEKHLLDGVDLASPLHSGYMYKEARTHLVFHRRFFVLFPRVLVYYAKEAEYKKDVARGNLEHCHKAVGLEGLYLSKPEKKPKGAKFCFILHVPDKDNKRHDFLLVAESKEERKHWIEALQEQNPSLLDPTHHAKPIQPDTPQTLRKIHAHSEDAEPLGESPLVTSSSSAADVELHSQGNGEAHHSMTARPGSPRHDIHRLTSGEDSPPDSDHLHLDLRHLDIREGPSDGEDN